jgi:hypothetical protein
LFAAGCGNSTSATTQAAALPTETWVKRLGDGNTQGLQAVAVDPDGAVLAAGYSCGDGHSNAIDFGAGKRAIDGDCGLFAVKYAATGALLWAHTDGAADTRTKAYAIAPMPSGRVLVGGVAGLDLLLDELGPDGKLVAKHRFHDAIAESGRGTARAIAIAPDGDWLVAGEAEGRVELGTGPLEHVGAVPFVARYAPDGNVRWLSYAKVESKVSAAAHAIALTRNGDVAACGRTDGSRDGAHGGGFVQWLDGKTGAVRWTKIDGGDCDAIAAFGDVVVANGAGGTTSLIAFDGQGAVRWRFPSTPAGLRIDALAVDGTALIAAGTEVAHQLRVLRLDAKGAIVASKTYAGLLYIHGVAASRPGFVLGGQLEGRVDFGVGDPVAPERISYERPTNYDALLARLTW